ncbi:MAG TPA: MBL fold metallo-hydrolase [Candidatus Nitrosocosmicus sp.]|nr:MBL fold metallo-hydrolase [Candidatus Nitrosocosmicus sp.]
MNARSFESSNSYQDNQNIMATVLQNLPKECALTKIEYEGPRIALHTNNPQFLLENNKILPNIVAQIKKRIVLRTDVAIRKDEDEARKIVEKYVLGKSNVTDILFDPAIGEATIFLKKLPQSLDTERIINEIILATGWKITFKKTPRNFDIIKQINKIMKKSSEYRIQFYKKVGEKIFRDRMNPIIETSLISLGGFAEVGRSSVLLSTNESSVLLDCGLNTYTKDPLLKYPRFDSVGLRLSEIDAILLTHAHFDHTGFLPVLFKYGFIGPVYCTEPTAYLMFMLFREFVKNDNSFSSYDESDIEKIYSHLIFLNNNIVTDLTPEIKVTPYNAGHILGSSSFHFHIGNGDHNFVYTGDIKFGKSAYLENAVWNFPRVETLLIECTNGGREDSFTSREESEIKLIEEINKIIKIKKTVLIPTQLIGTSQEMIITLNQLIKEKKIKKCKIYVDELIAEVNSIHEFESEFLNKELHQNISTGENNPFRSRTLSILTDIEGQNLDSGIVICPSSMLHCESSRKYLKRIATDPENLMILTTKPTGSGFYKDLSDGNRKFFIEDEEYEIRCKIEALYSFNSHSDFNQLNAYIARLRPKLKRIIVNHGERSKVQNFSGYSSKVHNIPTQYLQNQESIRIL